MVKIWMRQKPEHHRAGEICPLCGFSTVNAGLFPMEMCMGGKDGKGNLHPPVAMIRVHQKKGYFPRQKRTIFR